MPKPKSVGPFICPKCNRQFKILQALTFHKRLSLSCGEGKRFICHVCHHALTVLGSLHDHLERCHPQEAVITQSQSLFATSKTLGQFLPSQISWSDINKGQEGSFELFLTNVAKVSATRLPRLICTDYKRQILYTVDQYGCYVQRLMMPEVLKIYHEALRSHPDVRKYRMQLLSRGKALKEGTFSNDDAQRELAIITKECESLNGFVGFWSENDHADQLKKYARALYQFKTSPDFLPLPTTAQQDAKQSDSDAKQQDSDAEEQEVSEEEASEEDNEASENDEEY